VHERGHVDDETILPTPLRNLSYQKPMKVKKNVKKGVIVKEEFPVLEKLEALEVVRNLSAER
jgi:hypothetical protein